MWEQVLIQFTVIILSFLLFFLLKNYWPKYFEAKAANQATKEDIGAITEIVEQIKNDLINKTEQIKAELSILNQHKLNLKSAEREALIDLNKKVSAWFYSYANVDFTSYGRENYQLLDDLKRDLASKKLEADISAAHITLFMHDPEFIDLRKNFFVSIIRYETESNVYIEKFKSFFSIRALKHSSTQDQQKLEFYREEHEEFMQLYNEYKEEHLKRFETAHLYHAAFVSAMKKRLELLFDDN